MNRIVHRNEEIVVPRRTLLAAAGGAALLAACGGGGGGGSSDPAGTTTIEFTQQPAAAVGPATGSVTFSAGVNVRNAVYQWQNSRDAGVSWQDIAGAVLADFVLSALSFAMDGWQFRVIVSAAGVTKTSAPATLRVKAPAPLSRLGGAAAYDPVLGATVLADANLPARLPLGVAGIETSGRMSWARAKAWVAALNAARHLGYGDWRLPKTRPINGTSFVFNNDPANPHAGQDGSMDLGRNISAPGTKYAGSSASELAYLFYNTTGSLADMTPLGAAQSVAGNGFAPLSGVQRDGYWSQQPYGSTGAMVFDFSNGGQGAYVAAWPTDPVDSGWHFFVMVMRDGDSAS